MENKSSTLFKISGIISIIVGILTVWTIIGILGIIAGVYLLKYSKMSDSQVQSSSSAVLGWSIAALFGGCLIAGILALVGWSSISK